MKIGDLVIHPQGVNHLQSTLNSQFDLCINLSQNDGKDNIIVR